MKRKYMIKFWQFQSDLCWYKKGCEVLKFWIYHVWLQGIIQTSLLGTCLIFGAKALLSTMTTTLDPKTFLPPKIFPYRNWKRRIFGDRKELFAQGEQKNYTTPLLLSRIILVRRYWSWRSWSFFLFYFLMTT